MQQGQPTVVYLISIWYVCVATSVGFCFDDQYQDYHSDGIGLLLLLLFISASACHTLLSPFFERLVPVLFQFVKIPYNQDHLMLQSQAVGKV